MAGRDDNVVRLKVHLTSPPERVYEYLSTDAGRAAFWADAAEEHGGVISFRFSNGMEHTGKVLAAEPPCRYAVEYFGGSHASFELEPDDGGGTDLTLIETGIPDEWLHEHRAGWVTVLLALKAAVDYGVDLRNTDPQRSWEAGYVDV